MGLVGFVRFVVGEICSGACEGQGDGFVGRIFVGIFRE